MSNWISDREEDKQFIRYMNALQPKKFLFYLKPPQDFLEQAEEYRQSRGIEPPKNSHVTLFLFQANPLYSQRALLNTLDSIAEETPQMIINMRGWDVFKDIQTGNDLLVLRAQHAEDLKMLHVNIGASIVRPNLYAPTVSGVTEEERLEAVIEQRYGSRFFGARYHPHMTFGKLKGPKPESDDFHVTWRADAMYVSVKDNGWQEIGSFRLAKPF